MDMLNHVVMKQFGDDGIAPTDPLRNRMPGECVDAYGWRNLQSMLRHAFVGELSERIDPVPDSLGRFWTDEATLQRYKRTPLETEVGAPGDGGSPDEPATAPEPQPSTPRTAGPTDGLPPDAEPSYKPEMFRPGAWRLSDGSVVKGKGADARAAQLELEREGQA